MNFADVPLAKCEFSVCVFLLKSAISIPFYYGVVVVDVEVDEVEVDVELVELEVLDVEVLVELVDIDVDVLDVEVVVDHISISSVSAIVTLWYQYRIVKKVEPSGAVAGVTVLFSTSWLSMTEADGAA